MTISSNRISSMVVIMYLGSSILLVLTTADMQVLSGVEMNDSKANALKTS